MNYPLIGTILTIHFKPKNTTVKHLEKTVKSFRFGMNAVVLYTNDLLGTLNITHGSDHPPVGPNRAHSGESVSSKLYTLPE